jgi:uncharacterized protein YodC (DUF2158 family)
MKVGDVVQLKSGGPKMTVEKMFDDESCSCVWFSGTDRKDGLFPVAGLTAT